MHIPPHPAVLTRHTSLIRGLHSLAFRLEAERTTGVVLRYVSRIRRPLRVDWVREDVQLPVE